MKRDTQKQIALFKNHYRYCKDIVDRIDNGENIQADSIAAAGVGQRQQCVYEVNIAVDRLAALGNFDLKKIK